MKKTLLICSIFLLFACKPADNSLTGYVEGEFVYVAPTTSGNLIKRNVSRGDEVNVGDELFALDTTILKAELAQAKLEVEQANSKYADLTKGKRIEEIEVIRKQKAQANANLENAKKEYERYKKLSKTNVVSKSDLDEKTAAYKSYQAKVQELSAQLKVAELGARDDEVDAALLAVSIAEQKVAKAQRNLDDAQPKSNVVGRVEDTFYRAGEYVGAGKPVVAILPPQNIKIRFFVSQKQLPQMQQGKKVMFNCDGCQKPVEGKITYIASKAEFTPPVIYSVESRQKLVYMVEARPLEFNPQLRPGLPLSIIME